MHAASHTSIEHTNPPKRPRQLAEISNGTRSAPASLSSPTELVSCFRASPWSRKFTSPWATLPTHALAPPPVCRASRCAACLSICNCKADHPRFAYPALSCRPDCLPAPTLAQTTPCTGYSTAPPDLQNKEPLGARLIKCRPWRIPYLDVSSNTEATFKPPGLPSPRPLPLLADCLLASPPAGLARHSAPRANSCHLLLSHSPDSTIPNSQRAWMGCPRETLQGSTPPPPFHDMI
ncbi:hypothetical protein F5X68DRAFT_68816 [Plectosphaerella plurivora]|uniref:Uncharacterized protein n=1 Tax=Plectosphaerella plurivora TaxID=936078 RepID=A0A9P8VE88_9PEZI|nr:hypothetical protein F5X68DRAFT_68816 [Plectosphaerella plurivora]